MKYIGVAVSCDGFTDKRGGVCGIDSVKEPMRS
jgi:hypothetical protein